LINNRIPLSILTDSKGLFDVVTRNSLARERLLNIDIVATQQAYSLEDISDIGLIMSEDNRADAFTKRGQCNALRRVNTSGIASIPVQWMLCNEMASSAMGIRCVSRRNIVNFTLAIKSELQLYFTLIGVSGY
jgi:hypothetical protein